MSKVALGKGLSALISTDEDDNANNKSQRLEMPLSLLVAGKSQPRLNFDEKSLNELAESIKKNGVLQPILVRKLADETSYEIIAGERRFRASQVARLETIPVIIKNIDDSQALEIALIENIQRENLSPIEEAEGYNRLKNEFNYTQEQLASLLGKSRSHVANMLRLLTLPQEVKEMLNNGLISIGHARVLVGLKNSRELAERIVSEGLNVREIEKIAVENNPNKNSLAKDKAGRDKVVNTKKDPDLIALEKSLSETTGLKVVVEDSAYGGRVMLYFNNLSELDLIIQKIG